MLRNTKIYQRIQTQLDPVVYRIKLVSYTSSPTVSLKVILLLLLFFPLSLDVSSGRLIQASKPVLFIQAQ